MKIQTTNEYDTINVKQGASMQFLSVYGLFLLKLISVVIAILLLVAGLLSLGFRAKEKKQGKLAVHKLNDKYKEYETILSSAIKDKRELKHFYKTQKKNKKTKPPSTNTNNRIFVLHFHGDIRASAVEALREEITALLTIAEKNDEIVVCLDSGGGLVNAYGLAASQLQRIKDAKIQLTVVIDKVAASGGYMMACVADHIIAAPFAIIGSIGVLAQIPNFHRYLQKKSIDFEQLTAGEYKRTLTLFGENTERAREKMQQEINETHVLFKAFIQQHRPNVDINQIATGEHWYGTTALNLNLVDRLQTSDDYLLSASKHAPIYEVCYMHKKSLGKRLRIHLSQAYHSVFGHVN